MRERRAGKPPVSGEPGIGCATEGGVGGVGMALLVVTGGDFDAAHRQDWLCYKNRRAMVGDGSRLQGGAAGVKLLP